MKFLIVQHVEFEGPVNIEAWITSRSHEIKVFKPWSHLEMNENAIESMIKFAHADLERTGRFIQGADRIRALKYQPEINRKFLFRILDQFFSPIHRDS